jgi:ornithine carbamoyltransferase
MEMDVRMKPDFFKGRSLLSLLDLTDAEMLALIDFADELKQEKRQGRFGDRLLRRNVALLFEKASTRTRCATLTALTDEGGMGHYLASSDIHLGKKETIADTARVFGRMFDGIMFRGSAQATVEALAFWSGIPVWNGLTAESHPTQALADLMTIRETFGRLKGLRVAYVGDGGNNVACSLMRACAKAGMHFANATPFEMAPSEAVVSQARAMAEANGGSVTIEADPRAAVRGANVVYTDVWVSMGQEAETARRLRLLRPYQVDGALMEATGLLASNETIFLHCLPAFHNADTEASRELGALEVTDDVFESGFSRVFDQAENRLHTIKAVMAASIGRCFA